MDALRAAGGYCLRETVMRRAEDMMLCLRLLAALAEAPGSGPTWHSSSRGSVASSLQALCTMRFTDAQIGKHS